MELVEDQNFHLGTISWDPQFTVRRERLHKRGIRLQIDWGRQPVEHHKSILVDFLGATGQVDDRMTLGNLASHEDTNEDVVRKFDTARLLFAAVLKDLNISPYDYRLIPRYGKYDMQIEVGETRVFPTAKEE
ncbi:hypothetical protein [Aliiroseovarius sp. YM-037]|uniref:hypothetical protein n=1 Tax=Aliiroseovarius sp. YM-037 TaxID=3341728 RepID=UPI003A80CC63